MIRPNMELSPVKATAIMGGKYTSFGVPQFHREGDRDVSDGFINVNAKGEYDFHRGDLIRIKEITGAKVSQSKWFTVYAEIEFITMTEKRAEPNRKLLESIPDDL